MLQGILINKIISMIAKQFKLDKILSYVEDDNELDCKVDSIEKRLNLHNSGKGAKFTRGRRWKVMYKEKHSTKSRALAREYYIKKTENLEI